MQEQDQEPEPEQEQEQEQGKEQEQDKEQDKEQEHVHSSLSVDALGHQGGHHIVVSHKACVSAVLGDCQLISALCRGAEEATIWNFFLLRI